MIRKTKYEDVNAIMDIINDAKLYLKEQGINQWQDGYPNRHTIEMDINNDESYVIEIDNEIVATCMISKNIEPSYHYIEGGKWLCNDNYIVLHRIATKKDCKGNGFAGQFLDYASKLYPEAKSIRMDTHEENLSMQKFFLKNGFIYCGIIYLPSKDKRRAYEKRI